jgi:hypothetical protein
MLVEVDGAAGVGRGAKYWPDGSHELVSARHAGFALPVATLPAKSVAPKTIYLPMMDIRRPQLCWIPNAEVTEWDGVRLREARVVALRPGTAHVTS